MTHGSSQTSKWRVLLAIFVAAPVALYAVFCACIALWTGVGLVAPQTFHPFGIGLLGVAALVFWYVYSLFRTLLTDRGTPRSAVALSLGVIGLSYFLWHIVQTSIRSADYGFQAFAVAPVLFGGLVLSAVLFVRIAFADRLGLHRRDAEP
jgi:hypothetical protein